MSISIKVKNSEELGRFLEIWAKELDKAKRGMEEVFQGIGDSIADMILDQIPAKLGAGFGDFMAERTGIHVAPTQTGFRLEVFGYNESEIPNGKVGKSGQDYNLWAFYEFGGEVGDRSSSTGLGIQKDVASVAVIKNLAKGFRVEGKQGAIQVLVGGLMPRIERMIAQGTRKYYNDKIAKAANKAAREAGLKGFELLPPAINVSDLPVRVKEVLTAAVNSEGIASFVGRSATGQFISLGNKVKKKLG